MSQTESSVCFAAVRGNKGALLSLTHLSLMLWKNASLSLSSTKSKNVAFSGLLCTGLLSVTVRCNVSSLELISPAMDVSASGSICPARLDVWTGSLALWMVNLVAAVLSASKVLATTGLLNHTFFLYTMGLLLVSWGSKMMFDHENDPSYFWFTQTFFFFLDYM